MAAAEENSAAGRGAQAADQWVQVVDGGSSYAAAAEEKLAAAIAEAVAAQQAAELAGLAYPVLRLTTAEVRGRLTEGLYDNALEIIDARSEDEPRGSFQLLENIAGLAPEDADLNLRLEPLLERLVAVEPDDPQPASELAILLEERGELDRCEQVLTPHSERLGTLEGARILGQIHSAAGELDKSRALLLPYTEGRLQSLAAAQRQYEQASEDAWTREIDDAAGEEEQSRLVQEWIGPRLQQDPALAAAETALVHEAAIVPVALDLGIVMVQRAHGLAAVGGSRRARA